MPPNNVFLVGPMGVGKTTVGKLLAEDLALPFLDTDREIEARAGADIPWIFDVEGEEGFRAREARVLSELSQHRGAVLATGGGIILREDNRKLIKDGGFVVYLTAPLELLVERTSKDKRRPLLQVDDPKAILRKTMEQRDPLYREVADLIIASDAHNSRQLSKDIASEYRRVVESPTSA